jgi:hypothetical protein
MTSPRHIDNTGYTIAGHPVWTADEIADLRQTFPDRKAASLALPRRSDLRHTRAILAFSATINAA